MTFTARLTTLVLTLIISITAIVVSAPTAHALLEGAKSEACKGVALNEEASCDTQASTKVDNLLANVLNILSFIAGVLAVIFIMIAGIRFITSNGDSNTIAQARTSIIYAVIGLVVAALSQIIVQFVIKKF